MRSARSADAPSRCCRATPACTSLPTPAARWPAADSDADAEAITRRNVPASADTNTVADARPGRGSAGYVAGSWVGRNTLPRNVQRWGLPPAQRCWAAWPHGCCPAPLGCRLPASRLAGACCLPATPARPDCPALRRAGGCRGVMMMRTTVTAAGCSLRGGSLRSAQLAGDPSRRPRLVTPTTGASGMCMLLLTTAVV